jgi:hypothetical protein
MPELLARWKRSRKRHVLERVFAHGQARALGLNRLTEAELETYVEQTIAEVRRRKRGGVAS